MAGGNPTLPTDELTAVAMAQPLIVLDYGYYQMVVSASVNASESSKATCTSPPCHVCLYDRSAYFTQNSTSLPPSARVEQHERGKDGTASSVADATEQRSSSSYCTTFRSLRTASVRGLSSAFLHVVASSSSEIILHVEGKGKDW